jgi:acetyl esterase/lipase
LINSKNDLKTSYRLAPEFPLESVNDCYAVTDYVLKNPAEFKGIEDQIILAGDSAGKFKSAYFRI